MSNSRHTFSFSNMTFGNNSNYNVNLNHLTSIHHGQNESDFRLQMNLGDFHENFQTKSNYQKVFDGLKPYNQYQTTINEPQSQQQYQIQDNEYLNIEQSLPNKIDKLVNRINEHILKQKELNGRFRLAFDGQVKMTSEIKKSNEKLIRLY